MSGSMTSRITQSGCSRPQSSTAPLPVFEWSTPNPSNSNVSVSPIASVGSSSTSRMVCAGVGGCIAATISGGSHQSNRGEGAPALGGLPGRSDDGERERDDRPPSGSALGPGATTVRLHDVLDEGKPDARTPYGGAPLRSVEALEDAA